MSLILTQAGLAALVNAESTGTKVQATDMAVGDGGGSTPEHTSASLGLIHENWRGPLQSITVNPDGETEAGQQVVFEVHIPITTGGWYIRECAIYAEDVLLAIGSHPTMYKPDPEDPTKMEHLIKAPLTFGNAASVSLVVDPSVVLASQTHVAQRIAEHDADAAAHGDLRALVQAGGDHAQRIDNPHAVTAEQVGAAPTAHATDTDNPHGVTAAQLGLGALAALNTVGGAEIRDNAVGLAHLAHGEAGKILGYDGAGAPAALDALPLSKSYVSGSISITTAGTFSLSHGLGETPKLVSCHLLCAVAEHGYATGDIVPIGPHANDTGQGGPFGQSLRVTPSSIYGRFANSGGVINYLRHDTGDSIALTKTSWRLLVSAWA